MIGDRVNGSELARQSCCIKYLRHISVDSRSAEGCTTGAFIAPKRCRFCWSAGRSSELLSSRNFGHFIPGVRRTRNHLGPDSLGDESSTEGVKVLVAVEAECVTIKLSLQAATKI